MSPDELDNELEELENRLERLRALYDQYFLGIEKIEPNIARKDVDRRIWMLRREQIRNTARRFRLQTLVMRYNTFQQYWQRICRDIENGTYTRHMLRAERNIGETEGLTIAARKRLGMFRRGAEKRDEREQRRVGQNDGAAEENEGAAPSDSPEAGAAPAVEQSAAIPRPKLDDLDLDMEFFAALEGPEPPAPARAAPATAPRGAAPRAPAPLEPPAPPILPSATVALVPPAPAPPAAPRVAPAAQRAAALPPVAPAPSRAGLLSRLGQKGAPPPPTPKPIEAPATGEARRASTPPPAAAAGLSRPAADRAARLAPGNPPNRPAAVPSVEASGVAKAPTRDNSGIAPVPARMPKAAPAPPPRQANAPAASAAAEKSPRETAADKPGAPTRSAVKNPPPRTRPATEPKAASSPKASPKPAGVTDERIRELHVRLLDAKRQVNDGGKVSVDGLSKSLRAAESRLRQQHGDRRIDFDVVIKDGKAVVKPILR